MSQQPTPRRLSGGRAVVECIRREGVRHVFNVPGESYLAALDAFFDTPEIQVITNRHEGAACYMAEAYGKATRSVGVCFVTRGPGATHASIGIHCAAQDSTPLVLFVGQVPRANKGREAFQEVDYGRFFGSMAKWVVEIDRAEKVPEMVTRAFHVARSGRPGPVVVALPEDMLVDEADVILPDPVPPSPPSPDPAQVRRMTERLNAARRPVVLVGGGVQFGRAREPLVRFAERFQVPVVTAWRRNDAFPNSHPHYGGNTSFGNTPAHQLLREADLVLVIGSRLTENTTAKYALPVPGTALIHVDAEPTVIGRYFPTSMALVAGARQTLEAALEQPGYGGDGRGAYLSEAHQAFLDYSTPAPRPTEKVAHEQVVADLQAVLPADAVLTTDAGNNTAYIQRYYRYDTEDSFLGPIVGSMGYAVPAAVAAKLAHPDRVVVGTCGDGGFLMTGQELATAVQYGANIVHVVYNNGTLGTIRMHQERDYPQRLVGTDLVNPDFAALARAYGAEGYTVNTNAEFRPALEAALAAGRPALLDVRTDVEHISAATTLGELRARHTAR